MLAAPNDDAFSKFVEGRLWRRKRIVVPRRKFSQERSFRFVAFRRIWVKSLSEPVVKFSQIRNEFLRRNVYWCIS